MVKSTGKKSFYFTVFLLPAAVLYFAFFIYPFIQGVQFSFTDWNGITPEIPLNMDKAKFENEVIKKISNNDDLAYLKKYYTIEEGGDTYNLSSWIVENGVERQLNNDERKKLKSILASVGITPIKFIGFQNYIEMFKGDMRFVPRWEKNYLFKEWDSLYETLDKGVFESKFINHITDQNEKNLVLSKYKFDETAKQYVLDKNISDSDSEKLTAIFVKNMYEDTFIPGVVGFTLFFTIFNVLLANLLALVLALILDSKLKFKNTLRSIFFMPNVLSLIIVAYVWSFVFRLILPNVTGIDLWLGDTNVAPWAVVMVSVWQAAGYYMLIYLAGLQTIPTDVLEGARIDGASGWQKFKSITLPLLVPAMTICLFYSLANSLKSFDIIFALTSGGPGYATTPIVLDIYFNAFLQNRFGYGTAKAVFLCAIIMVITGVQLYLMKRKEVEL